jgi:hypothetical protein
MKLTQVSFVDRHADVKMAGLLSSPSWELTPQARLVYLCRADCCSRFVNTAGVPSATQVAERWFVQLRIRLLLPIMVSLKWS